MLMDVTVFFSPKNSLGQYRDLNRNGIIHLNAVFMIGYKTNEVGEDRSEGGETFAAGDLPGDTRRAPAATRPDGSAGQGDLGHVS